MTKRASVVFKIIKYGSHDYAKAIHLKEEILRKPLGLTFTPEDLENEREYIHIIGLRGEEMCSTVALVPEGHIFKMRGVAVQEELQGQGIASAMMAFCEAYALQHGYKEIYCHARETAIPFYKKNNYLPEGELFLETTVSHLKMRKVL